MAAMDQTAPAQNVGPSLGRRLVAEAVGTGLLVAVVVGSGIAAQRLSPEDVGLQLLENSLATALGLTVLILLFGPVSGAHFNPVVTIADWLLGRRSSTGLRGRQVAPYLLAQIVGGLAGAALADAMFAVPPSLSTMQRVSPGMLLGEVVATAVLVLLIFALAATGRSAVAAPAVGAYIGAAYWFTSSTSFANPAVTIGRTITDTFAGIAPASAGPYIAAQLVGAALGLALTAFLFPAAHRAADQVVLPRVSGEPA